MVRSSIMRIERTDGVSGQFSRRFGAAVDETGAEVRGSEPAISDGQADEELKRNGRNTPSTADAGQKARPAMGAPNSIKTREAIDLEA